MAQQSRGAVAGFHRPRPGAWILLTVLACGAALFLWRLGSTGPVDETPPLFAAAARAMVETGDWLTPRVNGLPRYDKPPLVYWLMALGYGLPGRGHWDPLGGWASCLPSALATLAVMLALAATLWRWPQAAAGNVAAPPPRLAAATALGAALAFALSPLVLLWGRLATSDALFNGCLSLALLLSWQRFVAPDRRPWWWSWGMLGLAVLAKGPVAVVLLALTLGLFGWLQGQPRLLLARLRPWRGLALCGAVALPWYAMELLVQGRPFWDSFFGYHNLQRFSAVVNHHLQPWWYFGPVLVVASLPFTPLLLAGVVSALRSRAPRSPEQSLALFAACWLLAVLLFFTLAATKLPSYWIPATPAAGVLIALAGQAWATAGPAGRGGWCPRLVAAGTLILLGVLALGLGAGPVWVQLIHDPEMPTLPADLLASGLLMRACGCFALAVALGLLCWPPGRRGGWLLGLQLPLVLFGVVALRPMAELGDRVRQQPVRAMAAAAVAARRSGEPLAMVGILKPSLHYYSRQVVLYEGVAPVGLVNLSDRLSREWRRGQQPSPVTPGSTVLVVIDAATAALPHWRGLPHQTLAAVGLFRLWRVPRLPLAQQARALGRSGGVAPDWNRPRPERY